MAIIECRTDKVHLRWLYRNLFLKKRSLLGNFFSSGLQAIAVQLLGVAFFYIISLYLSKNDFGVISWANAVSAFVATLLCFGLDQGVTRRIALSHTSDWAAAAFLLHALATSALALGVIIIIRILGGDASQGLQILPWVFGAQAFTYTASSLKQYLNAKEQFTPYGAIAFFSNVAKIVLAVLLVRGGSFGQQEVVYILVVCAAFELVGLLIYVFTRTSFRISFRFSAYTKLVRESAPLYFAMLFDSSLSRMDWILLGLISTSVVTADYSFAYRAYEIARLPLTIIGPVILPKFVRMLSREPQIPLGKQRQITQFLSVEVCLAVMAVIALNIVWEPWVGAITQGKYGPSNNVEFMLLSLCLPFHFFINLLWTITYAAKHYRHITIVTVITAVSNLVLNLCLIPAYGGLGAAMAYVLATVIQAVAYYIVVRKHFRLPLLPMLTLVAAGAAALALARYSGLEVWPQLLVAILVFTGIVIALRLVGKRHIHTIRTYLRR